jgi:hypothetical protein
MILSAIQLGAESRWRNSLDNLCSKKHGLRHQLATLLDCLKLPPTMNHHAQFGVEHSPASLIMDSRAQRQTGIIKDTSSKVRDTQPAVPRAIHGLARRNFKFLPT